MLSFVGITPPLGIIFVQGIGPFIALIKSGPPTCVAGNILTISAPNSSAKEISETDPQPGIQATFLRLQTFATSGFKEGATIKFAPN